MEFLKNLLILACFATSILAQKTYRRACDCEYTIDGKCAYTLLLPKGQDTCAQGGSTGGGDSGNSQGNTQGNSMEHMSSDVMESLMELQMNISQLWMTSGDQARMLNQLHSRFLSQQDSMHMMQQNISSMLSEDIMSMMMNSSMIDDITNMLMNYNNNVSENVMPMMQVLMMNMTGSMNEAMMQMQMQFTQLGEAMGVYEERLNAQTTIVESLSKDVANLTESLNLQVESLQMQMRMDYFLCHQRGLLVSGSEVNIPDDQITASSQFNANHNPARSRINTMASAADYGAWCPAEPNLDEWIQVDLGTLRTVFAIVTRGRPDYSQWVTQYKLQYADSLADDPSQTEWVTYKDLLNDDMLFEGNNDQNTQKINQLWQPIRVRHVRIVPTAAYQDSNKCMRVDLLGCVDSP